MCQTRYARGSKWYSDEILFGPWQSQYYTADRAKIVRIGYTGGGACAFPNKTGENVTTIGLQDF